MHDECQDGLACGSNNCPALLCFDSEVDCCYQPTVGDEHFCTTENPCDIDQGDCDSKNECQTNLICDTEISCPEYLGFKNDINCCFSGSGCEYNLLYSNLFCFIKKNHVYLYTFLVIFVL